MSESIQSIHWVIRGQVQGVGFRPFIYRTAMAHGLTGWVRNSLGQVEILGQGDAAQLQRFEAAITAAAPAIARPVIHSRAPTSALPLAEFTIAASDTNAPPNIHVPPDYFTCPACLAEMADPANRRYAYPFINCTQCGPRYTLIRALPYDRANTTMAAFELCPECRAEYTNPADRRFHAEPVACPACGPQLTFQQPGTAPRERGAALEAAVAALEDGRILAVKGIGGYHLMCDATRADAIDTLRRRKHRPAKPLAVMFPEPDTPGAPGLDGEVLVSDAALAALRAPSRPIVLLPRAKATTLPDNLAPGLAELGVMLPYSPLHHLLLARLRRPVVATSANLSGEPVLTDNAEVEMRLVRIADAFLHHDRPIQRPADDSVLRPIADAIRPLRLGRGAAPVEITLPRPLGEPVLAVGAHMKNTIALAWEDRMVVSPHIGDMGSRRSLAVFEQVVADLQALFNVRPNRVLCDAHPDYTTHRWAKDSGLPVTPVHHHHAHASALYGEHELSGQCLIFTWDGTGLGPDGRLWGGETLLGRPGQWRHLARLRPFHLPGGDQAGREPWRAAAAVCWESGREYSAPVEDGGLVRQAWERRLNTPVSSAAGRLFDAAACLVGLLDRGSYEGEGPMRLEQLAAGWRGRALDPVLDTDRQPWQADWAALIAHLRDTALPAGQRAADFHATLAGLIAGIAVQAARHHRFEHVGLTGGVFQNRALTQAATELLDRQGFRILIPKQLPCNDAAISAGQVYEYCYN